MMRPTATTLLATLMAVALVACSGGGAAEAPVPEDFTLEERGVFSLAVPPGWTVETDTPERLLLLGPEGATAFPDVIDVKVGTYSGPFDGAVLGITDPFRIATVEDYEVLEERDAQVAGAELATFVDGSYQEPGAPDRTRQWDLFASDEGATQLVYLSIKAPAGEFDEAVMTQVVESLQIDL